MPARAAPGVAGFLHALLPAHPLPAARQELDQSPLAHREHAKTDVISLTLDKRPQLAAAL